VVVLADKEIGKNYSVNLSSLLVQSILKLKVTNTCHSCYISGYQYYPKEFVHNKLPVQFTWSSPTDIK